MGRHFFWCAFTVISASHSSAVLKPLGPYQAEALPDPPTPAFLYSSSIAYYDNYLIYAGSDGKIYGYDADSLDSVLVSDTSSLSSVFTAPQGFHVSSDGYLYFHDNAINSGVSQSIYRLQLSDTWPVSFETLDTGATSAIFAFAENPWTNTIWFSSADFFGSETNNFYLHQVNSDFQSVTLKAAFAQPNSGGNGPIIFRGPDTLLYGEAVFGGDGYFHLLNSSTGDLVQSNYLTFTGGLGDSTYGYNKRIYATSGPGRTVFELQGSSAPFAVAETDDEARGIAFGDANFFVSEMVPFTTGTGDDGNISFNRGSDPDAVPEISPIDPFRARAMGDPSPAVFTFQSSIAYYDNYLIYAGSDGKIYGYNLVTSESTVVSDTSPLGSDFAAVQGFLVSSDDYLYFHDNALTSNIYRLQLSGAWPATYDTLDTGVTSAIFAFAENPKTRTIWFSSSDFFGSETNNFYLYQVNSDFQGATLILSFSQPNSGGNGPLIFEDETTLLYGEAVFGGNGYFHKVDTLAQAVIEENYLTLDGGLGDATYGYNNQIYVTSGGGKSVFQVDGTRQTLLATTNDEARSITFDGRSLFISAMVPFSGGEDDGEVSLLELWQTRLSGIPPEQRVDDTVDLNADGVPDNQQPDVILAVNTANGAGAKQLGVSPVGSTAVIESLESVAADTIAETANRPTDLPFDLVNYRLKVTSDDGTAQVTVYLSEAAPAEAKWYKYDTIDGWIDFSDHASFSGDRKSVTIELKDGDYGDLDRLVNGEIVDPGGIGVTSSPILPPTETGSGGGSCFVDSSGIAAPVQTVGLAILSLVAALCTTVCILKRCPRRRY
jgi:hypothetical protein